MPSNTMGSAIDSTSLNLTIHRENGTYLDDSLKSIDSHSTFIVRLFTAFMDAIAAQGEAMPAGRNRLIGEGKALFSYAFSKYGVACVTLSLIVNRAVTLASANRAYDPRIYERTNSRFAYPKHLMQKMIPSILRILSLLLLLSNLQLVLVALNLYYHICTPYSESLILRKFLPDKYFRYDAEYYASKYYMMTPKYQVMVGPTSNLLWPVLLSCFLLKFVNIFLKVLHRENLSRESGLTSFEISVAFQEFTSRSFPGERNGLKIRPNEEILVLCIAELLNHISLQLGALVNGNKYRLIPLSIVGFSFLLYFYSRMLNAEIIEFPINIIFLCFVPLATLIIIIVSAFILLLALIVKGFELESLNYGKFFLRNELNEEDSSGVLGISMRDDFYSALTKLGSLALVLAGKFSYIEEMNLVSAEDETWLEKNVWQKFKSNMSTLSSVSTSKFLKSDTLVISETCGYENLVLSPPCDKDNRMDSPNVIGMRMKYASAFHLLRNFVSFMGFLIRSFLKRCLAIISQKGPHINSPVDINRSSTKEELPGFLKPYAEILKQDRENKVGSNEEIVNIDDYSEEELSYIYPELFQKSELSQIDTSNDFQLSVDEYSDDLLDCSSITEINSVSFESSPAEGEIFSLSELMSNLTSKDIHILREHICYDSEGAGIMTRSKYRRKTNNLCEHLNSEEKMNVLLDLILEKRQSRIKRMLNEESLNEIDQEQPAIEGLECVICQVKTREIITWPCRCFAICETCRLSMAAKGFESCVCCRRPVDGFSRVYIP